MNNIPLVSIIVPVYNIEKYISKCIESVLSQTFKDWELILVDDGSTDNSGKICDEYALKDNRIKVIHKENEGVTATRDRGVKEAQGEFLFFIDGDDYITDNALELLINKQKENDADLVRGSFCTIKENGEIINKYIVPKNIKTREKWFGYIANNSIWSICNSIFRAETYKHHVNAHKYLSLGEDLICSSEYALGIKSLNTCSINTYYYVQRQNSAMHTKDKNINNKYEKYLLMINELNRINYIYKNLCEKELSKIIERLICSRIFLNLFENKDMLQKHKRDVFKLYMKYYALNFNTQIPILKNSWKCYLYNWWCLTKFI